MAERFRLSYTPEHILAGLATADLLDRRYRDALHRHKDAILPGLRVAAAGNAGPAGLNANCILLELGDVSGSTGLVDRINRPDGQVRSEAMQYLAQPLFHGEHGGGSRTLLRRVAACAAPATAMTIHWILKGIAPREVSDLLMTAGIAMPGNAEFALYEARWHENHDAVALLMCLLASSGSLATVMVKTNDAVPDHTKTVAELCTASRGFFDVEDLYQAIDADGELTVGFVYKGKHHILSAERLGRFLDLRSILTGLNDILGKSRNKGRFFQLRLDGGSAVIVFALKREFLKVARKLRIPLETDRHVAGHASMACTRQVPGPV